ncbi:hypothetical protein BsWGS_21780 [Bradybaena similaris]
MKAVIIVAQILLIGALADAQSRGSASCSSSGQCSSTKCCLKNAKSKTCAPRVSAGSACLVANDALLNKYSSTVFNNTCPCTDGYKCQSSDASSAQGVCTAIIIGPKAIPGK